MPILMAWLVLNLVVAISFICAGGQFDLEEIFETKEDIESEFSPFWYNVLKIFFVILFLPTILVFQIGIFIIFLFIIIGWVIYDVYKYFREK